MITKEKLIELLDEVLLQYHFDAWENSDKIADFILAHWDDADKWIPVSEMPNEACEIIVTDGIRADVVDFSPIGTKSKPFGASLRLVCNFVDGTTMYPTHWMTMPELPKEIV